MSDFSPISNGSTWHLTCDAQGAPQKINFLKTQQRYLFPEPMTRLLKMIHRRCGEHFHGGHGDKRLPVHVRASL